MMLTMMALLTCLTIGYGQRHRFWLVSIITPLMIAIVMGLIADMDSSRSGFLRVDLRSMERLYRDFQSEIPEPVPPSSTVR
jgi:nitrate/nitrite transporter NarK